MMLDEVMRKMWVNVWTFYKSFFFIQKTENMKQNNDNKNKLEAQKGLFINILFLIAILKLDGVD
jgi:hypothetical protein